MTAPDPFDLAAERFKRRGASVYLEDPVGFSRNCFAWKLDESLTAYQQEILQSLQDNRRVAVRGPHGLGKTTTKAHALLWFACTREACGIDWKVVTTAGAWRQLEFYLWPEIHKWAKRLRWDLLDRDPFNEVTELQKLNLKLKHGMAVAVATSNKELIEGAHADHIMYLFDESKAISNSIFDAAEGAFSTDGVGAARAYALAQSTPGEPIGRFYDIHMRKPGLEDWKVRHVTPREAIASGRMSIKWLQQRKAQWGADSALYANRALGEFHSSDIDSVIPLSWVEAANERWYEWDLAGRPSIPGRKVLGTDVARGGSDLTVISERQGWVVTKLHELNIADTVKVADAAELLAINQTDLHVVDIIGVGAGVGDTLRSRGANVIGFNASRKNRMRDRSGEMGFANNRSAMWWKMREALDPAFSPTLALPPHEQLTADLTAPKYTIKNGRYVVEPKDATKERLGRSTDYGDSVCQTLCTDLAFDEPKDSFQVPKPVPYAETLPDDVPVYPYAETSF